MAIGLEGGGGDVKGVVRVVVIIILFNLRVLGVCYVLFQMKIYCGGRGRLCDFVA
jgi:hypothetical protein